MAIAAVTREDCAYLLRELIKVKGLGYRNGDWGCAPALACVEGDGELQGSVGAAGGGVAALRRQHVDGGGGGLAALSAKTEMKLFDALVGYGEAGSGAVAVMPSRDGGGG